MAVLIQGLQGSGKSYKATYDMYYQASKYHKIFTNIDGIKTNNKIELLQFKDFMNTTLLELYEQQVELDLSFDDCIQKLQEKEILPQNVSKDNRVLIVVDEAQNYFGKSVKLLPQLVWFITQHRHLYIELYLITQKYTLLRSDYHLFNLVYEAYPPVKQFSNKSIKYAEYAGLPLNDDNLSKKFSLKKEQKIFDMYVSGDKVESPNILKRYIFMFIGLLLLVGLGFTYFLSTFGNQEATKTTKTENTVNSVLVDPSSITNKNHEVVDDLIVKKFYTVVVTNDDAVFYIWGVNKEKEYPIKLLSYLKDEFFIKIIDRESDSFRTLIHVLCNVEMIDFLNEDIRKEKEEFGEFNSFSPNLT
jgi:zona occludens toxin